MDIVLTRILECMGNRYGAGKDLANHLGISGNVITNWKNNKVCDVILSYPLTRI